MRTGGLTVLKFLAVGVALLFLLGAMLTAVTELFGGSKIRPLFGMSADALAGPPTSRDAGDPSNPQPIRFNATKAALVPVPVRRERDAGQPLFMPASKSFGGEALPGVKEQLQAPPPQPQQNAPAQ